MVAASDADVGVADAADAAETLPRIPKRHSAMVYDSSRSRVVLFGGFLGTNGPKTDETWEWDGSVWLNVTPVGSNSPAPRSSHALAYDAARQRVVLFGGSISNTNNFSDTWEWDGTRWSDMTPGAPGPPARRNHKMAYDSDRSRVVLLGGQTNSIGFDDIWEWDGTAWIERTPGGLQPPRQNAIAYDLQRSVVVLFGRTGANVSETWEWDGTIWTKLTPTGPVPGPRLSHRLAYDAARGRVVLFGGETAAGSLRYGDTWEWNGSAWSDVTPVLSQDSPSARRLQAMTYDGINDQVMLFGGGGQGQHGDTWLWSGTVWLDVSP